MSVLPVRIRCGGRRVAALLLVAAAVALHWPNAAGATTVASEQQQQEAIVSAAQRYFPSDEATIPPKRIFRLTRDQLDASVKALLPKYQVTSVKAAMGKDPLQTNYEYAELLGLNPANLGALSGWIKQIAGLVRKDPAGVVNCTDKRNARDCHAAEARRFLIRAFRGDVTDEKIERFVEFFVKGAEAIGVAEATAELVEVTLNSPDFLFRKELDVDRYRRLAPAQLLQALTYTIADVPPDALKFDYADPGRHLASNDTVDATLSTIVRSKASRDKLHRFFKSWLEVKEPAEFTISLEAYPEFSTKLAAAMLEETNRFLQASLSTPAPKLSDITQATQSFVSPEVAALYAIKPPDAAGIKPVALDPEQRFGIFSQPAVLASHSGPVGTRPIKRGVFWVRKVMCMELDPPPNGIDSTIHEVPNTTERQRIEQVTKQKACSGCHKMIDPFGFFQESYDALGRWRTQDNGFKIDTSIALDMLDEGPVRTASPVEALKAFTGSMMFKQCFVRQLYRFYMGRSEEPADDPLLRSMFLAFARTDDLLQLVETLAASNRIGRRQ